MSKFIIKNWMGQETTLEEGKSEFNSFGDARDAITEFATWLTDKAIADGKYERGSDRHEEAITGIEEDFYAVNVDDDGNELPDEGQYRY